MASGIPVITSRCDGVDDYCEHGKNCLMVNPTAINEYVDAAIVKEQ